MLWHQGETDVPLTSGSDYQIKLDGLIGDLRSRYGANIPFVIGQMGPEEMERSTKDYSAINAVHEATPTRVPRTAFVEGPRDAYNSETDRHYSAAGAACPRARDVVGLPRDVVDELTQYCVS